MNRRRPPSIAAGMCAPHSGPVATVRDGSRSAAASAGRHRHRSTGVLPRCGGSRGRGGRPAGYPRRRGGLSRPAGHVPSSSDGSSRGSPRRPSMAATSARSSGVMWASAGPMGGGVGQVRAGQVAEPGEVTRAGRIIGRVRGRGRHPAVSSSSPVENGRRDRAGERARMVAVAAAIVTSHLGRPGRQAGMESHRGRS